MDATHRTAIGRICCMIVLFLISTHRNLAGAAILEFCQVTDHLTSNATETGMIKSPGFGTRVRDPDGVPNLCTIFITVCPGCRLRLSNTSTIDCASTNRCFLRHASVELEGFPMEKILFQDSISPLNVTSFGRSVNLVFRKSPIDAVTGQYGFYIYYKVMRPEPIKYNFDPNRMSGTISSPGFPNRYASNEDIFTFHFEPSLEISYLQLNFSDWYLSKYSRITIQVDSISTAYDYLSVRPFVTAYKKHVLVTVETGIGETGRNYIGFKAMYLYSSNLSLATGPVRAGNDVFDSVFGGKVRFQFQGPGRVDYVWAIPRSDLVGSDRPQLKLRIDSKDNLPNDALEIRSGPTSESVKVNWTVGNSLLSESGFYFRLRSEVNYVSVAFSAVFVWTRAVDIQESSELCRYTDFHCRQSSECLMSGDLVCDGVKHCDDATDEIGCTATSKPCPSYWTCRITQQLICVTRRCNGIRDCLDSSDELSCPLSTMRPAAMTTWHPSNSNPYANYNTLSIALPLVMLGVIIVIIIGFITCIALRRKRRLSIIRRPAHNEAPPDAWNPNRNVNYSPPYAPNLEAVSPPPYSAVALYHNQGFTTSPGLPVPPPYAEIDKPLVPTELSALPPPYMPSDETVSMEPPRDHSRTSPRRTGEQRMSGSTDSLMDGDTQC